MEFLLGTVFSIGYVVSTAFGTGGAIVIYSILAFFFNIKDLIVINTLCSLFVQSVVFKSSIPYINKKDIIQAIKYSIPGTALGLLIFCHMDEAKILPYYSFFIILVGLNGIFRRNFVLKKSILNLIFFIGGVGQGLFGIGGPLFIMCFRSMCNDKSIIRANIFTLFIILDIIRLIFLIYTKETDVSFLTSYLWICVPLYFGILLGNALHKKISQESFVVILNYIILFSGILYFVRSLCNIIH